jgi:hypothetical protein
MNDMLMVRLTEIDKRCLLVRPAVTPANSAYAIARKRVIRTLKYVMDPAVVKCSAHELYVEIVPFAMELARGGLNMAEQDVATVRDVGGTI